MGDDGGAKLSVVGDRPFSPCSAPVLKLLTGWMQRAASANLVAGGRTSGRSAPPARYVPWEKY